MAPFNKRQIGYIQAIAGRQQHRTLICGQDDQVLNSTTAFLNSEVPQTLKNVAAGGVNHGVVAGQPLKSLLMQEWLLDNPELSFDSRATQNNALLESADFSALTDNCTGRGSMTPLNCFLAPCKGTANVDTSGAVTNNGGEPTQFGTGDLVMNPERISSLVRATPDGYLNSTHVKLRFTLPTEIDDGVDAAGGNVHPMGVNHYEFRWIVWRHKQPTMSTFGRYDANADGHDDSAVEHATNLEAIRDGRSFRNPAYDFFMGQTGRKRGFLGYTLNEDLDSDKMLPTSPPSITNPSGVAQTVVPSTGEIYSGHRWATNQFVTTGTLNDNFTDANPSGESGLTVDDIMTGRINRDDYVVMKDVRFFLGKEHGKSHFEDTLHWDWNDPIDTPDQNVLSSSTLNEKNYRWHMTLLGTTSGAAPCHLNTSIRWTTKMESG